MVHSPQIKIWVSVVTWHRLSSAVFLTRKLQQPKVVASPSFAGFCYLKILDLCKNLHSSLSLCWFPCGFSCWETILIIILFPSLWGICGQNMSQICSAANFCLPPPICCESSSLSTSVNVWDIMPVAEVCAGACARPKPHWGLAASPLTHGAKFCIQTEAQWDQE